MIDFDNVTKTDALDYAEDLGEILNYMSSDDDVDKILYNSYAFENFDKDDIMSRLDLLVPENMYAFVSSQIFNKEFQANPAKFQKERFY